MPDDPQIDGHHMDTVVNYGQIGCGAVYREHGEDWRDDCTCGLWNSKYGDPDAVHSDSCDTLNPIVLKPLPTRIFGIGMHKTATTSLHKAFGILGFDSLHWGRGEAPLIWEEVNAAGRSMTLERFYAACDMPIPLLYRKLDEAYPGSKFILTIRDEAKWLKSVERLWDPDYNASRWQWDVWPISNRLHKAMYGRTDFDAETFLARYRRHNAEVREYFEHRPDDLLVMDMETDGWPELCTFLDQPMPSVKYPHEYKTRERGESKCS
jgi:Sulfotransferase domain